MAASRLARSSSVKVDKSRSLGRYRRMMPLAFSLEPCCQGLQPVDHLPRAQAQCAHERRQVSGCEGDPLHLGAAAPQQTGRQLARHQARAGGAPRFKRRTSGLCGTWLSRLLQQAAAPDPMTRDDVAVALSKQAKSG